MALSDTLVTVDEILGVTAGVGTSTHAFSPAAGSMVRVVAAYLPYATTPGLTFTCQDSAGNAYTTTVQEGDSFGASYCMIFDRQYATAPGSVTVKVTCSNTSVGADCLIEPHLITGQAASQTGAKGTANDGGTTTTALSHSLTTTTAGSLVHAGLCIPATAQSLTVLSGTTQKTGWSDTNAGGSAYSAVSTTTTGTPGPVTFGWTDSAAASFGWVGAEVLPASPFTFVGGSFVNAQTGSYTGGGSSFTVTVPAGVANGDLMLMTAGGYNSGTLTVPAGWTTYQSTAGSGASNHPFFLACRIASSEPSSYTVTSSVAAWTSVWMYVVRGGITSSVAAAVLGTAEDAGGEVTALAVPSYTPSAGATSLLIYGFGGANSSNSGACSLVLPTPANELSSSAYQPAEDTADGICYGFLACTSATVPSDATATASIDETNFVLEYAAVSSPVVATTSLPLAQEGDAYSATVAATGGTTPYTWSVSSGSLPGWASLNSSTGVISGTAPGTAGSTTFTIEVTDASSLTATQSLTLVVAQALLGTPAIPGKGQPGNFIPGQVDVPATAVTHNGTASLSGTGTLTAVASVTMPGAATLSGAGSLTAAGHKLVPGSASLTGSGALTATGIAVIPGSASLSGTGSLTAAGNKLIPAAASLSGAGSLTAAGFKRVPGSATLTGSGSLTATGSAFIPGSASLAGTGALSAAGSKLIPGAASLSGSGSLGAAGYKLVPGVASLAGTGSLGATGNKAIPGAASLSGAGALTAAGFKTVPGAASLAGSGSLTANGTLQGFHAGTASLSGAGSLSAAGHKLVPGAVSLSGTGSLTAAGFKLVPGAATFLGAGSLTASGFKLVGGAATLTGTGSLAAQRGHLLSGPLHVIIPGDVYLVSGALALALPPFSTVITALNGTLGPLALRLPAPVTSLSSTVTHNPLHVVIPHPYTTMTGSLLHQPLRITLPGPSPSLAAVIIHDGALTLRLNQRGGHLSREADRAEAPAAPQAGTATTSVNGGGSAAVGTTTGSARASGQRGAVSVR